MTTSIIQFMPKLSKAGKMPCESFSLPAQACKTGSKLAQVKGSVCHGCYALKGNYRFPSVKAPREHNLALLDDLESWQANMIMTIKVSNASGFFRWHDSGDVQNYPHLLAIINIARELPSIRFWLPTKEKAFLSQLKRDGVTMPDNLTIRLSMAMIDQAPSNSAWTLTSTVHQNSAPFGTECAAYTQGGKCLTCRKCWDNSIDNISYPKH
jgi:hypothetical protein